MLVDVTSDGELVVGTVDLRRVTTLFAIRCYADPLASASRPLGEQRAETAGRR